VALIDNQTDRTAVKEAIASGRQERFTWIDASHFNLPSVESAGVFVCVKEGLHLATTQSPP